MADEQAGVVIVDAHGNEHHFPAGFDPTKAAGIVHESTNTMKPVGESEPDTYLGGALKGAKEGMIGGATGFAKGIVPGAAHGVVNSLMAIPALAKGLLGTAIGAKNLIMDPEKTLTEAAESMKGMKGLPAKASEALNSALKLASQDPEAFGKAVGDVTGQTMVGIAGAKALPLAPKPIAKAAGNLMEQVGTKGAWPIRMMGAHQLGSGDPLGLLTMAMPGGLKSGGEALQKFGGADTAKGLPSGARTLDVGKVKPTGIRLAAEKPGVKPSSSRVPLTGSPAEASSRVQKVMAKESAGARSTGELSLEDAMRKQGLDPSKMVSSAPVKSGVDKLAPRTMPDAPAPAVSAPTAPPPALNPMETQLAGAGEEVDLSGALNRMGERRPQVSNAAGRPLLSETGGAPLSTPAPPPAIPPMAEEVDLSSMLGNSAPVRRPQVTNRAGRPYVSEMGGPAGGELNHAPMPKPAPAPMEAPEVDLTSMLGGGSPARRAQVTSASGRPLLSEMGGPELSPMEAQMASTPSKLPLEGNVPASKSRTTPMSATPGLTTEDMKALGINPDMRVTGLVPESIEQVLAERAKRAAMHRSNAGLDAGAKRALELDEVAY